MSAEVKCFVHVDVSKDHLQAWIRLVEGVPPEEVNAQVIAADLEAAKIATDDAVVGRISEFATLVSKGRVPSEPYLVAEGRAAVDGKDGAFRWAESFTHRDTPSEEEDQVDYRSMNFIRTVEKDAEIGKVLPPTPGVAGIDVYGNELRPRHRGEPIKLTANVRLDDDGETAWSTAEGRVVAEKGRLAIVEVLEIRGDVNFESGNIDATSDVSIRGTVVDLFRVASNKSIRIGGAIEAAYVTAGENLQVRGGILARDKGTVSVGGDLAAKFCTEARVRARGDVHIAKEVINSQLHAEGKLFCERGAIIGGQVYAKEGISVHTLGSDSCVATKVRIGIAPEVLWKVRQLDEEVKSHLEAAARVREAVQPLMNNLKRLSPDQKERATELLFKADEMEMEINTMRKDRETLLCEGSPQGDVSVVVNGRICAGVTIAIGDRATRFSEEMKGPVKIEKRKMEGNATEFVSVNQVSGSVTVLKSMEIALTPPAEEPAESEGVGEEQPASADSS